MKRVLILLTASLLCLTGCAKNRWLSRRDYSEMQDPFATEGEAIADAADKAAADGRVAGNRSGRARVQTADDAESASVAEPLMRGPKPIQRASAGRDAANGSQVSTADYPQATGSTAAAPGTARSLSGPELSDFLNGRTTQTASMSAEAATPRINRTSRPPQMPAMSSEAAGFYNSLDDAATSGESAIQHARATAGAVQEDAGRIDDWMREQQAEWSGAAGQAQSAAKELPGRMNQSAQGTAAAMSRSARAAIPEFDAAGFAGRDSETAEPLIKSAQRGSSSMPNQTETRKSAQPSHSSSTSDQTDNPFDNPFETDVQPAAGTTSSQPAATATPRRSSTTASGGSNADLFGKDSGWRPAELTRP